MTYEKTITLLGQELLDKRAWPDDTTKLAEQLDLLYVAAIAVGSVLPLSRFSLTSVDLTENSVMQNPVPFDLPADLFVYREDLGIQHYAFNGKTFYPHQSSDYERVQMAGSNGLHKYTVAFVTDSQARLLYLSALCNVKLTYLPLFSVPVNDPIDPNHYQTLEYPLKDTDVRRAIHLIAAHKSGVTIRDNAMAVFHDMLSKTYAT